MTADRLTAASRRTSGVRLLTVSAAAALALAGCGAPQGSGSTGSGTPASSVPSASVSSSSPAAASTSASATESSSPTVAASSSTSSGSSSATATASSSSTAQASGSSASVIQNGAADANWVARAQKVSSVGAATPKASPTACVDQLVDQRTLDAVATLLPDGPAKVVLDIPAAPDFFSITCTFSGATAEVHVGYSLDEKPLPGCVQQRRGEIRGTLLDDSDGIITTFKDEADVGQRSFISSSARSCTGDDLQSISTSVSQASTYAGTDIPERKMIEDGALAREITAHRVGTQSSWLKSWQSYDSGDRTSH